MACFYFLDLKNNNQTLSYLVGRKAFSYKKRGEIRALGANNRFYTERVGSSRLVVKVRLKEKRKTVHEGEKGGCNRFNKSNICDNNEKKQNSHKY